MVQKFNIVIELIKELAKQNLNPSATGVGAEIVSFIFVPKQSTIGKCWMDLSR